MKIDAKTARILTERNIIKRTEIACRFVLEQADAILMPKIINAATHGESSINYRWGEETWEKIGADSEAIIAALQEYFEPLGFQIRVSVDRIKDHITGVLLIVRW